MKECIKYVGLDVHKSTIAVAIAEAGSSEVRYFGEIPNTPQDINKVVKKRRCKSCKRFWIVWWPYLRMTEESTMAHLQIMTIIIAHQN